AVRPAPIGRASMRRPPLRASTPNSASPRSARSSWRTASRTSRCAGRLAQRIGTGSVEPHRFETAPAWSRVPAVPRLDAGIGAAYWGRRTQPNGCSALLMAVDRETPAASPHPRTWVMMGHKAGDNSQILALAEGLGWPFEIKHLVYRPTELLTNLLAPLTLLGIVRRKSSPLEPPWPDLIISAGRRNEPPCRWIQRRADKRVRLVHVGRPWARIENFDLVVTTPQYRLPDKPNVLHNTAPLQRVADERLREAARVWAPRLAHLPRP